MKTIRTVLASICVMASAPSQGQENATEAKGGGIEQRTWPAVSNGLVFVEGEFLPPPYIVSRVRNAIFINERHVESPAPWPVDKKTESPSPPSPQKDPVMPLEITDKTTIYDNEFIKYNTEKKSYLFAVFGQEKGVDKMVEVYRSLPCVKTAERDKENGWTINVTWKSGETYHICQVPPQRKQDRPEEVAIMMNKICEIFVKNLENNDYFMFGSAYRNGTQDGYGQFLVPIAEAFRTAKDEDAFLSVMTNKFPMSTGFSEKAFRSFYKHKDKLPQWEPLLQKRCKGSQ